jgi:hypothetical protein
MIQPSITWLHLSDIHLVGTGSREQAEQFMVLEDLVEDVTARSEFGAPDPDYILVSGDIAATAGCKFGDEYLEADRFIRRLQEQLGLGPDRVLVVPGNHDVQRASDRATEDLLAQLHAGTLDVDQALASSDALIRNRLDHYRAFAEKYGGDPMVKEASTAWLRELRTRDSSVLHMIGLNSALLCQAVNEEGVLQVGSQQANQLLAAWRQVPQRRFLFWMMHHPFGWLRDDRYLASILGRHSHVGFYGHLHCPRQSQLSTGAREEFVLLEAGATFRSSDSQHSWERDGGHAYGFGAFYAAGSRPYVLNFPRLWDKDRHEFISDRRLTQRNSDHTKRLYVPAERGAKPTRTKRSPDTSRERLLKWSERSLAEFGERRTAFPFDRSLREQIDTGITLSPTFDIYRAPSVVERIGLRPLDLVARLRRDRSLLVVGPPGSGKTVALYTMAEHASAAGLTPILVNAVEFAEAWTRPNYRSRIADIRAAQSAGKTIAVLIDGADEYITNNSDAERLRYAVEEISKFAVLALAIRTNEYEEHAADALTSDVLAEAFVLRSWTRADFHRYVKALVSGGVSIASEELIAGVRKGSISPELYSRPLLARLLSSLPAEGLAGIESEYDVYEGYIAAAEQVAGSQLKHLGCKRAASPSAQWREVASRIRLEDLMVGDSFDLSDAFTVDLGDEIFRCARRSLSVLAEYMGTAPDEHARFVHFSLYEYLAGSAFAYAVQSAARPAHDAELLRELQQDLSREMRHFAAERIRRSWSPKITRSLVRAYAAAFPSGLGDNASELAAKNLIVYFLSRSCPDGAAYLRGMLDSEDDSFLRCSLYWGLAHLGDRRATLDFIRALDEEEQLRSLARGHTLRYYGDLPEYEQPPYFDQRAGSTTTTVARVCAMLRASQYKTTIAVERWIVDLYVLYDLLIVRGDVMSKGHAVVCSRLLGAVIRNDVEESVGKRLLAMHAAATEG